jgi:hypothetical protein
MDMESFFKNNNVFTKGNYTEFVWNNDGCINVPYRLFMNTVHSLKSKGYVTFQKQYKEYVYRDMFFDNDKMQIKVYRKKLTHHDEICDGLFNVLTFNKEKMPYHVFPSSTKLHSITYVSKVIFKVHNRIFINCEYKAYGDRDSENNYHKIFINYNNDPNVDTASMEKILTSVITQLKNIMD